MGKYLKIAPGTRIGVGHQMDLLTKYTGTLFVSILHHTLPNDGGTLQEASPQGLKISFYTPVWP